MVGVWSSACSTAAMNAIDLLKKQHDEVDAKIEKSKDASIRSLIARSCELSGCGRSSKLHVPSGDVIGGAA